jgi:hypothetical protein
MSGRAVPLFATEEEIARLVLGPGRTAEWKGMATVLERKGLPAIDPQAGRRYWPAVKAFFDRRAGLSANVPSSDMDSMEIQQCPPMRRRRPA